MFLEFSQVLSASLILIKKLVFKLTEPILSIAVNCQCKWRLKVHASLHDSLLYALWITLSELQPTFIFLSATEHNSVDQLIK